MSVLHFGLFEKNDFIFKNFTMCNIPPLTSTSVKLLNYLMLDCFRSLLYMHIIFIIAYAVVHRITFFFILKA